MKANLAIPVCLSAMTVLNVYGVQSKLGGESAGDRENQTLTDTKDNDKVTKVMGHGVGINETEALKDAYRDAVERAVGSFVNAEAIAKNDEVVKDQILSQSNAYIQRSEKIGVYQEDGLWHVKIAAEVKKAPLVSKVSSAMQTKTVSFGTMGESMFSRISGIEKKRDDSISAVKRVFDGYDPVEQLAQISLAKNDPVVIDMKETGKINAYYLVKVEIDRQKYCDQFLAKFKEEIGRVAIGNNKTIRFSNYQNSNNAVKEEEGKYLQGEVESIERRERRLEKGVYSGWIGYCGRLLGEDVVMSDPDLHISGQVRQFRILRNQLPSPCDFDAKVDAVHLVVIEETSPNCTFFKARQYDVGVEVGKYLSDWLVRMTGAHRVCDRVPPKKEALYNVALKDSQGNEISVSTLSIRYSSLVNCAFTSGWQDGDRKFVVIIAPFVASSANTWYQWVKFSLDKDDLPKIVDVAFERAN